ncbi:MAG TPA: protein kinase, partial [Polyangia bacterium]
MGTHVGNYEIKGILGENETGVVYRGRHVASDRPVVIKILHERSARQKDVVDKFIGEAKAASSIRHTNLVEVADLGTAPDGTVFLVMEYLEGESLRSRLHRVQRLPLFEAINIVRQVARGLGAAHEAGITHGGLNPSDIFLCRRTGRRRIVHRSKAHGMRLVVEPEESFDLVKLLDFGMAKFLDLAPGAPVPADTVSGTFRYLSPEQAQGQAADPRSDIYALGAVFYEMVTGAVPFGGESLVEIVEAQTSGQVIAPSRCNPEAGINGRIEILILRCLKKNPSQRFASTGELCEALDACVTDCAFLRDAHRLPGIMESGIDLSKASPQVRQDPARSTTKARVPPLPQKPPAIPTAKEPAKAPMAKERAAAVSAPPSAVAVRPEDPSAAASTLPPAGGAADLPAQIPAW